VYAILQFFVQFIVFFVFFISFFSKKSWSFNCFPHKIKENKACIYILESQINLRKLTSSSCTFAFFFLHTLPLPFPAHLSFLFPASTRSFHLSYRNRGEFKKVLPLGNIVSLCSKLLYSSNPRNGICLLKYSKKEI